MERYCGSLLPSIRSRSNPYPSLTCRVVEGAQLDHLQHSYVSLQEHLEWPPQPDPPIHISESVDENSNPEILKANEVCYSNCEFNL